MGNRALRVQLAQELKRQGFGKLYRGRGRIARKFLSSGYMKDQLAKLQFKPGDLVNDCDGFNWRIIKWNSRYKAYNRWFGDPIKHDVKVFDIGDQYFKTENRMSCGCSPPEPAWPAEQVNNFFKEYLLNPTELNKDSVDTPYHKAMRQYFSEGKSICDDEGKVLPELDVLR